MLGLVLLGGFGAMWALRATAEWIMRRGDRRQAGHGAAGPDATGHDGSGLADEAQAWLDQRARDLG